VPEVQEAVVGHALDDEADLVGVGEEEETRAAAPDPSQQVADAGVSDFTAKTPQRLESHS
jgi:hypothetical protein